MNYLLTISYDGTRYKGWQRLGGGENTLQGKIEDVLSKFFGFSVEINGAGRTDAGAHALGQTASFRVRAAADTDELQRYLTRYLPDDISILAVSAVPEEFHARLNAVSKTYLYRIWNKEQPNPFYRKYSMHIAEPLNLAVMEQAAAQFVGRHDFTAFTNAKSKKKSMVRTIESVALESHDGLIDIRITGDGFLYNMARRMVGVLIEIGKGKLAAGSVAAILAAKERSGVPLIAEAGGLFLESVRFSPLSLGENTPE